MSRKKTKTRIPEIHQRRFLAALGQALRYRIATPEALAECHALLFQAPLYRQKSYFFLTAQGGARIGAETIDANEKPFSESAKIHALAFVVFCCLHGKHRTRLTRDEIKEHFSDLYRPGIATNYYVDRAVGEVWPKLFQNCRSTRQTELQQQFPGHVVAKWLGNTTKVAAILSAGYR